MVVLLPIVPGKRDRADHVTFAAHAPGQLEEPPIAGDHLSRHGGTGAVLRMSNSQNTGSVGSRNSGWWNAADFIAKNRMGKSEPRSSGVMLAKIPLAYWFRTESGTKTSNHGWGRLMRPFALRASI